MFIYEYSLWPGLIIYLLLDLNRTTGAHHLISISAAMYAMFQGNTAKIEQHPQGCCAFHQNFLRSPTMECVK